MNIKVRMTAKQNRKKKLVKEKIKIVSVYHYGNMKNLSFTATKKNNYISPS